MGMTSHGLAYRSLDEAHRREGVTLSLRLEKQSLRVETVVGDNTAQSVLECTVVIPSDKPEIGRALRVSALPTISSYDISEGQISIEGYADIDVLYASFTEVESVHEGDAEPELVMEERLEKASFANAVPFASVLNIPGAGPDMKAQVRVDVAGVGFDVQEDQRTVDVDLILEFSGVVKEECDLQLVSRVISSGAVQVEQESVRVRAVPVVGKGQEHVQTLLAFGGRDLPDQILHLTLQPAGSLVVRLSEGAAEVSGNLDCTILYTGKEVGAARAEFTEVIPLSIQVHLPGVGTQDRATAQMEIDDISWQVVDNDTARGVALEAVVLTTVTVDSPQMIDVVTAMESADETTVVARTAPVWIQEAVGEAQTHYTATTTLELPDGAIPIERVLLADARARVEDVHVLGDKVAVEGAATLNLMYVGRNEDTTSLTSTAWPAGVPFELEIAVPGAEPGLERRAQVQVDKVEVDLINRETIDVSIDLTIQVDLTREVELDGVLEAVEVPAPDPNPPTYTFVVLQPGDTLWQLAQKYHTDVPAIIQANQWLESEDTELTPGRKLCIPRFTGAA
jgi:LysM repeat protein